jgi:hypothetical protein
MGRHLECLGTDPFTAVEAALAAAAVAGAALTLVFAAPDTVSAPLRAATAVALLAPAALVVTLLAHAAHDAWRLAAADAGERLPGSGAGLVRACWRGLETLYAAAYALVVPFSLWAATDLPDTEAAGGVVVGIAALVLFGTAGLVALVAIRVAATALYRAGVDGSDERATGRTRR